MLLVLLFWCTRIELFQACQIIFPLFKLRLLPSALLFVFFLFVYSCYNLHQSQRNLWAAYISTNTSPQKCNNKKGNQNNVKILNKTITIAKTKLWLLFVLRGKRIRNYLRFKETCQRKTEVEFMWSAWSFQPFPLTRRAWTTALELPDQRGHNHSLLAFPRVTAHLEGTRLRKTASST